MRKILFSFFGLFWCSLASAGTYDVQCTAPCMASDGTTQAVGTVLQIILWNGTTPYTPRDFAGNSSNVTLISDPNRSAAVYAPIASVTAVGSSVVTEMDVAGATGGAVTLGFANGMGSRLVLTGSGTLATYTVHMPPSPSIGDTIEVILMGSFTITSLNVTDSAGNALHTFSGVTAPKRTILGYTTNGWQIIPN